MSNVSIASTFNNVSMIATVVI